MRRPLHRWLAALGLAALTGCATLPGFFDASPQAVPHDGVLTTRQTRLLLNDYVRRFSDEVARAADGIQSRTADEGVIRGLLTWKLGVIPAAYRAGTLEEAQAAFGDLWLLAVQMEDFFEAAPPRDPFGAERATVQACARHLREEIEAIARELTVTGETFERGRARIHELAAATPVTELGFSRRSLVPEFLASRAGEKAAFFQAVENLGDNLAAMQEMMVAYAAQLPAMVRWQAELMLLDLPRNQRIGRTLADFDGMDESLKRLAAASDHAMALFTTQSGELLGHVKSEREAVFASVEELRRTTLEALDAQRAATFAAIATERQATLDALTRERLAASADVESLTRKATESAAAQTRELIDHLFVRALELIGAATLGALVLLTVARVWPTKNQRRS